MAGWLRLTDAQVSALECRGLEAPTDAGEELVARCWTGGVLHFAEADREALFDALNEMSNREDAQHQLCDDVFAGRAARSLAAVASRVLRRSEPA